MDFFNPRPPLPVGLSHSGVHFIQPAKMAIDISTLVAIASALQELLPRGDFTMTPHGPLLSTPNNAETSSLWHRAGLLEGIERSFR